MVSTSPGATANGPDGSQVVRGQLTSNGREARLFWRLRGAVLRAMSDGAQSLDFATFAKMQESLRPVAEALNAKLH